MRINVVCVGKIKEKFIPRQLKSILRDFQDTVSLILLNYLMRKHRIMQVI